MPPHLPFTVSLQPGEPIAEQVIYAVTRAVVTGQLRGGDPFPSVRSLSQELKINPNTAHKIVAALVEDGLLVVRPGIGTVVTDSRRAVPPALDADVERIVIDARRAGMTLPQVIALVRDLWTRTSRRTSPRSTE
ncbi:MAG TPA: GntR family transcriptional regulator [Plantibacter sp.]|uniref:GntR family transcriptional regulator n=1 Tax=Plantibacter sp. TaxID=1871045 RepID=UPI002C65C7EB|nr:GntR family transcriptional regulator [Plantibacter sp.]